MKKYKSEIRVLFADTDGMGIVYHTNYIKWFEIGRNEYLRQIGFPYSVLEKDKLWLPVSSVECSYKLPAYYDDVLEISSWIGELKAATVVINYEIHRKSTGELLVTGHTKHAITDDKLKPVRFKTYRPDLYKRIVEYL
ncbi:MAG: acyl-CoA thioesterase [Peptostreptococcaceae bacterium]|nr:acyl-CoA thioesterase [Peptostreptococcaceae bacterium]